MGEEKKTVRERAQEAYERVRAERAADMDTPAEPAFLPAPARTQQTGADPDPELPHPGHCFRTGGSVPRNLYWVTDQYPGGLDIGRIDHSPELAGWIVAAANKKIRELEDVQELTEPASQVLARVTLERDQLRAKLAEAEHHHDLAVARNAELVTERDRFDAEATKWKTRLVNETAELREQLHRADAALKARDAAGGGAPEPGGDACTNCGGTGSADHPLVPTTICEDCKGTGVGSPPEPAGDGPGWEGIRQVLREMRDQHLDGYADQVEALCGALRAELAEVTADRDQRQRLLDASHAQLVERDRVEGSRVRQLRAELATARRDGCLWHGSDGCPPIPSDEVSEEGS